jgi:sugar phosphate isomerase/epimerase
MLSISTSFISQSVADGGRLLDVIADYGIDRIELDCRVTQTQFQQIKEGVKQRPIQVGSLHNYCPFPALKPNVPPGGDYFKLAALDRWERDLAVEWTTRTIENANDLEAALVVLHCGAVEMQPNHRKVYARYQAGPEKVEGLDDLISRELEQRRRHQMPHLDAIRFSLDRLLNAAQAHGVTLGLENRAHYFEIPDSEEFSVLFAEFEGAPMGYWHDTGHAHTQEALGIVSHADLLATHGERLVGIHLHDAAGLKDHLAPGRGEIDFAILEPCLKAGPALVIELAPGTDEGDVRQAVSFAQKWLQNLPSNPSSSLEKTV